MKNIYFTGQAQGKSMQPIINEGDKLFVKKVKNLRDIRIGDIVVFYQNKNLIGHRVIGERNKRIITKGDNLAFIDSPLKVQEILGRIVKIKGKYGTLNLRSLTSRIISYYFLFYSLSTYYLPLWFRLVLIKSLRGRKILLKLFLTSKEHRKI